jgi:diguanylate cyclase (GGDEF)-like protein
MPRLDHQAPSPQDAVPQAPPTQPANAMHYQAGYTDSITLMRMESYLLRVVGRKGVDALWQRMRILSGPHASSSTLVGRLLRLCADLLGEPLVQRMLQALQHRNNAAECQEAQEPSELLVQANEHLLLSALNAQAAAATAVADRDQLARTSQRDPLTDTPNRALLLDRLESTLTMAQRRGTRSAVFFLDIDHFKQINDTLGHATGDAVLQRVARRLQAAVRDSDAVGRHGGDEFLVLLAEVSRKADAAQIARKIISDIAAPSLVAGHMLHVSVSVGIAIFPDDAREPAALIAAADTAMYRAKRRGGGSYAFFGDAQQPADSSEAHS